MINKNAIDIEVNLKDYDKVIEKLNKIKQILKEIREIDNNFSVSNIIEADEDTILVFNCDNMFLKQEELNRCETLLSDKFRHKCILLNRNMTLDKAIGIDYAKGREYTTTTYYDESGNLVKEETTQYK